MLFYLDNWMSADPNGPHADAAHRARPIRRREFGRVAPTPARSSKNAPRASTRTTAAS